MKEQTKAQINKRYDYKNQQWLYEVHKTSKVIRENMTLGEDVGTNMEYRR